MPQLPRSGRRGMRLNDTMKLQKLENNTKIIAPAPKKEKDTRAAAVRGTLVKNLPTQRMRLCTLSSTLGQLSRCSFASVRCTTCLDRTEARFSSTFFECFLYGILCTYYPRAEKRFDGGAVPRRVRQRRMSGTVRPRPNAPLPVAAFALFRAAELRARRK